MTTTDQKLTASDPEPPPGTLVRDHCGVEWEKTTAVGHNYWVQADHPDWDVESWTKIAGNYGPVTVIEWGDADG